MELRAHAIRIGLTVVAVGALTACLSPQARIERREDNLAAAGFVVRPANTPERQAMLKRLPPNRFVTETRGDSVHYVYADPMACGCLYVGTQHAYARYQRHEQEQHFADEKRMTAENYSDAAWDWGAWGPWGPGFGFGYGPGIGW